MKSMEEKQGGSLLDQIKKRAFERGSDDGKKPSEDGPVTNAGAPKVDTLDLSGEAQDPGKEQREKELQQFKKERKRMFILEAIDTVIEVVVLLIVFLSLQYFVVSPFIVSGSSMEGTLHDHELILVDRIHYGNHNGPKLSTPARGDVIVFHPPIATNDYYIKRIIGVPGDTISFRGGNVYLNDKKLREPYTKCSSKDEMNSLSTRSLCTTYEPLEGRSFTVPNDHYFVMGDNRDGSSDSRICFSGVPSEECREGKGNNYVPIDNIIGRAWIVFWPFNKEANKPENQNAPIYEKFWPVDNPRAIPGFSYE